MHENNTKLSKHDINTHDNIYSRVYETKKKLPEPNFVLVTTIWD